MFAVLCEQFGMVFSICVLLMYAALIWRSMEIAVSARRSFHGLLSMGSVTMIGLQTFVIVGGVLRLIPLTGVPLPFISFGGTSLVSNLCLIGFVQGVACINRDNSEEEVRLSMLERG
jgi:cell division protein FtsW (lipid II flippase)